MLGTFLSTLVSYSNCSITTEKCTKSLLMDLCLSFKDRCLRASALAAAIAARSPTILA